MGLAPAVGWVQRDARSKTAGSGVARGGHLTIYSILLLLLPVWSYAFLFLPLVSFSLAAKVINSLAAGMDRVQMSRTLQALFFPAWTIQETSQTSIIRTLVKLVTLLGSLSDCSSADFSDLFELGQPSLGLGIRN